MPPAEEDEVAHAGHASVCPVLDVVAVAPSGRPITAGEAATAVTHDECSADCGWNRPRPATNVERLGFPIHDHPCYSRVACQSARHLRGHDPGFIEHAQPPCTVLQGGEIDGDGEVGLLSPDDTGIPSIE